jgi:hypothetical protein
MFNRGKRIEIIESSRQGSSGLKIGDLGYLENMFLFLNERFILASAIFLKGKKHRLEKKRFIIDLGMDEKSRLRILHQHTSRDFFASKQQLNLLPIIYDSRCGSDSIWQFTNYPDLFNSCGGVWNNKEVKSPSKIKIPICDIKLSPIKKSLLSYSNIEFEAWLRSSITIPIFLIYVNLSQLVLGEQQFYTGLNNHLNNYLITIHDKLRQYLDVFIDNTGIPRNISFTRPISDISDTNKHNMITMIRLATSLQYMLHSRYDAHMVKTLNDVVKFRELYDVVDYYYTSYKNLSIFESRVTSSSKFIMDFILSSIMRSIVTDDVIQRKLKVFKDLPRFSGDPVGLNDLLINESLLCSISNVKQKITSKVSNLKEALLVLDMSQKKKKSTKSKPKKVSPFESAVLGVINDRTFTQIATNRISSRHRGGYLTPSRPTREGFDDLRAERDRSRGPFRPVTEIPLDSPEIAENIQGQIGSLELAEDDQEPVEEQIQEPAGTQYIGREETRYIGGEDDDPEPVRAQYIGREGDNESIENGENPREPIGHLVRRLVLGRRDDIPF